MTILVIYHNIFVGIFYAKKYMNWPRGPPAMVQMVQWLSTLLSSSRTQSICSQYYRRRHKQSLPSSIFLSSSQTQSLTSSILLSSSQTQSLTSSILSSSSQTQSLSSSTSIIVVLGRGGSLVSWILCVRRVAGSNQTPAVT